MSTRAATMAPLVVDVPDTWAMASAVFVAKKTDAPLLKTAKAVPSYRPNLAVQLVASRGRSAAQLSATSRGAHERESAGFMVVEEREVEVHGKPGFLREQNLVDAAGFTVTQLELYVVVDDTRAIHALASAHAGEPFAQGKQELLAAILSVRVGADR